MSDREAASEAYTRPTDDRKGPIAWMARNGVAANLLMIVVVVAGLFGALRTKQEVFPEFDLDQVNVTVAYPGASPEEVEQGILLAIEERVRGLDGVKRVESTAREGNGTVRVMMLLGADKQQVLADVKNEVDRITTIPEEAEEPVVSLGKNRRQVVSLVIAGDQPLRALHDIAERARLELLQTGQVTQVELEGVPPLEIAIEVPRETLQAYGLSLQQIAQEVSRASLELPGGAVDTARGEVRLRVADRRKLGFELENVVLRGTTKGGEVRLGDIATITDGYEETDQFSQYDGRRAVRLTAYRVGDETPTAVAAAVRDYADTLRTQLPDNVTVAVWNDQSEALRDRIGLLQRNAIMGLILVLVILALFLDLRLAFWVSLGIPISFLGSFLVLGGTDLSVNMITLFAFIVTLGMVVDDAIVVGERIYALREEGHAPMRAAVLAAKEMAAPITFAILTTVAAFAPMFFVPGTMGKIFKMIPTVVIAVLLISLVESFFILPAHLGHSKGDRLPRRGLLGGFAKVQGAVASGLRWFTDHVYRPAAGAAIRQRYISLSIAGAMFVLTVGFVASGRVPFNFFPQLEGDVVTVQAQLPYGAPLERTDRVRAAVTKALDETIDSYGGRQYVRGVFTRMGEAAPQQGPGAGAPETGSHLVAVEVALVPGAERTFKAEDFANDWRDRTPPEALRGLESVSFSAASGPGAGAAVAVQLMHPDQETLAVASKELDQLLRGYPGLKNIKNEYANGKPQIDFHMRTDAHGLGLNGLDLANQIRASFYGAEAIREQRGRNEIKIVTRLPEHQRQSESDVEELQIRTSRGQRVPLAYVAEAERGQAATSINLEDGRRTVTVSSQLAAGVDSPRFIKEDLEKNVFPELIEKYPGLEIRMVGANREQAEAFGALGRGYAMALLVMFALLAIPFRSYVQPIIIMAVIPFGFVGAVAGHVAMGYGLSIMSMFGIVALSGVVVNDSLVLIDATNKERAKDPSKSAMDAVLDGGAMRLRPILLTSLTTFFGLVPMLAETSVQARFLIPMAISLGFGVLFATVIVLLLVPALYVIVDDAATVFGRTKGS